MMSRILLKPVPRRFAASVLRWWLLPTTLALFLAVFFRGNREELTPLLKNEIAPDGIVSFQFAWSESEKARIANRWGSKTLTDHELKTAGFSKEDNNSIKSPKTRISVAREQLRRDIPVIFFSYLLLVLSCFVCGLWASSRLEDDSKQKLLSRSTLRKLRWCWLPMTIIAFFTGTLQVIVNMGLRNAIETGSSAWVTPAAFIATYLTYVAAIFCVVATALLSWRSRGNLLNRFVLMRMPLLVIGFVQLIALLGIAGPRTFRNTLITTGWFQPSLIAVQLILIIHISQFIARFVWEIAEERFGAARRNLPPFLEPLIPLSKCSDWWRPMWFYAAALPLLTGVVIHYEPAGSLSVFSRWIVPTAACLFGGALAVGLLILVDKGISAWITGPSGSRKQPRILRIFAVILKKWFGPGYTNSYKLHPEKQRGGVRREHLELSAIFLTLAVIYIVSYHLLWPERTFVSKVPAVSYLLGQLLFFLSTLSGLAFLLDRIRIPVVIGATAWIFSVYTIQRVDHIFKITHVPNSEGMVSAREALGKRLEFTGQSRRGKRTVTVVCADGGGIQASAWTALVTSKLAGEGATESEVAVSENFLDSLALISSTSGGSVGSYYFLKCFDPGSNTLKHLDKLADTGAGSSLEEALWGYVFPDLIRNATPFSNMLGMREHDRAWASERAWLKHANHLTGVDVHTPDTRWIEWIDRTRAGSLPAVIFNSTIVESGQQMMIGTIKMDPGPKNVVDLGTPSVISTLQSVYGADSPGHLVDLDAVTAARLSATFPVVTPAARAKVSEYSPRASIHPPSWHLADGGFYDNSGFVGAVAWIREIMHHPETRKDIKNVVVIRIVAFPRKNGQAPYDSLKFPGGKGVGVSGAYGWPLQVLASVRTSSQTARSYQSLQLLIDQAESSEDFPHIELVEIVPQAYEGDDSPPLSWQLSEEDKTLLKDSWGTFSESPEYRTLEKRLGGQVPQKTN